MQKKISRNKLIVLTSTLPRWDGDNTPSFVLDHCKELAPYFKQVVVLAPHAKGAALQESIKPNIKIKRARYFLPESKQDIFYDGGGAEKVKLSPLYAIKLLLYFFSVSIILWREAPPFRKGLYINPNWVIPQGVITAIFKVFRPSVSVILHARGTDIFTLNSKPVRLLKYFALKKADIVFVNSGALKSACENLYKRDYIVQPTGFDNKIFIPKNPEQYRKNKSENLRLITAGRLIKEKGFLDIIQVVKGLVGQGFKIELSIAGDGPLKETILKYIKDHNLAKNIKLLGWVEYKDIVKIYQESDLYVGAPKVQANGWRESFGNVYTEAMACGTPILVTTAAGASEIIQNEKNGFVIDSGDMSQMEYYIKMLYQNPEICRKVGIASADTAKSYGKLATRDRYLEVIDAL